MKIFVAGGSGFIGKHLINELASAGHNIVVLIRPNSKLDTNLRCKAKLILIDGIPKLFD